ncbi:hypothetical protein LTS06_011722, partial [Exophiala xenobiotica]
QKGLQAVWRGKKHEDRQTQVAILLWESLEASHEFFTSSNYTEFHKVIQLAMNGRKIMWQNHVTIQSQGLADKAHLSKTLQSPAIEVAPTKVVEGSVQGYYSQFLKIVVPILDNDPGCDGHFISPLLENPQDQLLLINWKSIDSGSPRGFREEVDPKACIDGLKDYYAEFVIPWHIVSLKLVQGSL